MSAGKNDPTKLVRASEEAPGKLDDPATTTLDPRPSPGPGVCSCNLNRNLSLLQQSILSLLLTVLICTGESRGESGRKSGNCRRRRKEEGQQSQHYHRPGSDGQAQDRPRPGGSREGEYWFALDSLTLLRCVCGVKLHCLRNKQLLIVACPAALHCMTIMLVAVVRWVLDPGELSGQESVTG